MEIDELELRTLMEKYGAIPTDWKHFLEDLRELPNAQPSDLIGEGNQIDESYDISINICLDECKKRNPEDCVRAHTLTGHLPKDCPQKPSAPPELCSDVSSRGVVCTRPEGHYGKCTGPRVFEREDSK